MRRGVLLLVATAVAVLAAGAYASSQTVSVKPGRGRPRTRFSVTFRAPDRAGSEGTLNRQYDVSASARAGRHGCVSRIAVAVTRADAGALVRVALNANGSGSGAWCKRTFRGVIEETQTPVCATGRLCPLFVVLVKQIGEFTYRVH